MPRHDIGEPFQLLLPQTHARMSRRTVASAPPKKPRLVLAIIIDQFRYDYLLRFREEYTAGLARLLKDGAVFTDVAHARNEHVPRRMRCQDHHPRIAMMQVRVFRARPMPCK